MTLVIAAVFLLGYLIITLETSFKINKTATALLLSVVCWTLYMLNCEQFAPMMHPEEVAAWKSLYTNGETPAMSEFVLNKLFLEHLGDASEIIFFLLGAMTTVEVIDFNGGFDFVRRRLRTKKKTVLLWNICFMTFFLSAILDNLTTSIVMVMVLRKLVPDKKTRILYAGMVVLAANAGGAFSPIGDVTTIMLWIKGNVTSYGVISELFIPSIVSMLVPAVLLQFRLTGTLSDSVSGREEQITAPVQFFTERERTAILVLGVGGLMFVPVFRQLTQLPPIMGVLLVLSLIWTMTEIFYARHKDRPRNLPSYRVSDILHNVDFATILFFLGILNAVAALQETGALAEFGRWLNDVTDGNTYLVTGVIGVASSIVDNVPLVASCMAMYDIAPAASAAADASLLPFVADGSFWQLLAFAAGTGGSILIIGSAAGVIVMGLEKISFGWYFKNFSLLAFLGLVSGMICYYVEELLFF